MFVKEHPILSGVYVSSQGQIWEVSNIVTKKYPTCTMGNIHLDKYGYQIFTPKAHTCDINNITRRKKIKVHRLVAEAHLANPNGLAVVNHIDYNKANNCICNLEWVTLGQNNKGLHRKVSHYSKAVRMESLRLLLVEKKCVKDVSKLTGVTVNTLSEAKRGDLWLKERAKFNDYL